MKNKNKNKGKYRVNPAYKITKEEVAKLEEEVAKSVVGLIVKVVKKAIGTYEKGTNSR